MDICGGGGCGCADNPGGGYAAWYGMVNNSILYRVGNHATNGYSGFYTTPGTYTVSVGIDKYRSDQGYADNSAQAINVTELVNRGYTQNEIKTIISSIGWIEGGSSVTYTP